MTTQSENTFGLPEDNEHLAALEQEKARLTNAVKHLERSNQELQTALDESGPDKEYEDAVKENKEVVANYQAEIYKLAVEIAGIKGDVASVTPKEPQAPQGNDNTTQDEGQWL